MEDATRLLLDKAKTLEENSKNTYIRTVEQALTIKNKELDKARNLILAAQEICPHHIFPERSGDDYNYHKREDWTNYYCSNCNKLLRRN